MPTIFETRPLSLVIAAQHKCGVLCATPYRPFRSRDTIPSPLPANVVTSLTVLEAAPCAVDDRIASQTDFDTTSLIAISPTPVAVAAPSLLSAYNPAPRIGLSPILPGNFKETPPVESAAARFPFWSMASAPTVSPRKNPPLSWRSFKFLEKYLTPPFSNSRFPCFH